MITFHVVVVVTMVAHTVVKVWLLWLLCDGCAQSAPLSLLSFCGCCASMFDYVAHAWTVAIIFPHCLSGDSATGGNSARCRQPPSAPYCAAAPSMTNRPPPIVRLSDDEDGDVVDTFGGNKLAIGGSDGLGNTVGGPVFDLPLGPQHAWPALLQKTICCTEKAGSCAEKAHGSAKGGTRA